MTYNLSSLVLTFDRTPSTCIQISWYKMKREGVTSVAIVVATGKQAITATFVITLDCLFLPTQLIYSSKTTKAFQQ